MNPTLTSAMRRGRAALAEDLTVGDGWASQALRQSITEAALKAVAMWQVAVTIACALGLATSPEWWALVAAQAALAGYAVALLTRDLPVLVVPAAMAALGFLSYLAAGDMESIVAFTAGWQFNFATCSAALLCFNRWLLPVVLATSAALGALILVALPEWSIDVPVAVVAAQLSIVLALRAGLPALLRVAAESDTAAEIAEAAARQVLIARAVGRKVAEDARVLHDTVINTLGAIANGGAGIVDREAVRDQCAQDLLALERLSRTHLPEPAAAGLRDLFRLPGLPLRRTGLDDEALVRLDGLLGQRTVRAVVNCAREAVTNATKHSGADSVQIHLEHDSGCLRVTVADAGRGFDGVAPDGRGVQRSIVARARDNGIQAGIDTAPGRGTRVHLVVPVASSPAPRLEWRLASGLPQVVRGLYRTSGLLWAVGVTAVACVLTVAGGSDAYLALTSMIAVMTLSCVGYVRLAPASEVSRPGSGWLAALLAGSTCAAFLLSGAAVDFGRENAVHWQALAATGPFILLLSLRTRRRYQRAGLLAWGITVCAVAALVLRSAPQAAGIVVLAAVVGIGFCWVWSRFQAVARDLCVHAARAHHRAAAARTSADLETAAQTSFRRWVDAGLDEAAALLRSLAEGASSPDSPDVRAVCGEEEDYLRQLVQIGPELVHLGPVLMPTLAFSRSRGVDFTLRVGANDTPDEASAGQIADLILASVGAAPRGTRLTASIFPVEAGIMLTLLGPIAALQTDASRVLSGDREVQRVVLGDEELLQVTFAGLDVIAPAA